MAETICQTAHRRIREAIAAAQADGVNVFLGGDPLVLQVTINDESYLIPTKKGMSPHSPRSRPDLSEPGIKIEPQKITKEMASTMGFTGNVCNCGSLRMVRNGTCEKCLECGSTSGCS